MKKLLLLTLCLVGGTALFAQDKRHNFDISYEISNYKYEEPRGDTPMSLSGIKQGFSVTYLRRSVRSAEFNDQDRSFASVEFRYMAGDVDYDGYVGNNTLGWQPTKFDNLTDYYFELAIKTGWVFKPFSSVELWPYLGVGMRYLRDHLEEGGDAGYLRTSTYVYMPLGLQIKYQATDQLKFSLTGQFDWLLSGQQFNRDHPNAGDFTNEQTQGYGIRAGLRTDWALTSWANVFVEPFWRYWHIQNSLVCCGGMYEPFNTTREYGLRVGFMF